MREAIYKNVRKDTKTGCKIILHLCKIYNRGKEVC